MKFQCLRTVEKQVVPVLTSCLLLLLFCSLAVSAMGAPTDKSLGGPAETVPLSHSASEASALTVSIAFRSNTDDETKRVIDLRGKNPKLDIVIQNVSTKPQKIWQGNFEDGWDSLSFEITAIDGLSLPKARVIRRSGRGWDANMYLPPMTFGPGETLVREARLATYGGLANGLALRPDGKLIIPYDSDSYWGIPRPEKGDQLRISIRAVFQNGKSQFGGETDKDVWEGRIVSPLVEYTVFADPNPPGLSPAGLLFSQWLSKPTALATNPPPKAQATPQAPGP